MTRETQRAGAGGSPARGALAAAAAAKRAAATGHHRRSRDFDPLLGCIFCTGGVLEEHFVDTRLRDQDVEREQRIGADRLAGKHGDDLFAVEVRAHRVDEDVVLLHHVAVRVALDRVHRMGDQDADADRPARRRFGGSKNADEAYIAHCCCPSPAPGVRSDNQPPQPPTTTFTFLTTPTSLPSLISTMARTDEVAPMRRLQAAYPVPVMRENANTSDSGRLLFSTMTNRCSG